MQRSYHEEISEKKTITGSDDSGNSFCTSRNVSQDNGNINNFWKGSRWFFRQCLGTFCCSLRPYMAHAVAFAAIRTVKTREHFAESSYTTQLRVQTM